ncbi:TPA: hypothetical protein NOU12_001719 [Pseudomonas aeruginosa]|nr:hypothetical protein [Pseudomonas aeruginosa]
MPNRYLSAIYEEGGRVLPRVDCWGLTIIARSELFGLPMLSDFGAVTRKSILDFQRSYRAEVERALEECQPFPGAIAAAFRGQACVHVGLVVDADGRQRVLETNPSSGVSITPLRTFTDQYTKVIFYRDRNLSEQA